MMHIQYPAFSYHDWTEQYSSDGGQVYSLCVTNFELGTTTFDGKSILTWDTGKEATFNDMEVPDLCSVFDYKFLESEGSTISIQDQEERYQHLQQLYNEYTGTDTQTASNSKSSTSTVSAPTFVELNVSDSTIHDDEYYAHSDEWRSGDDRILDNGVEPAQSFPNIGQLGGAAVAAAAAPLNREINGEEYPTYPHIPYRGLSEDGEFQQDVIYRDTHIDAAQLGGGRADENDQSGWLVPPKGEVDLPPALRRRSGNDGDDIDFPRTDTNLFGDPEDIDPEYADNGEFPRTFQTVFDDGYTNPQSPDRRLERTKALTEEEWSQVLQKHRGADQERRAVGPQEWREIVDSYHGHVDNNQQYPGRRLLHTDKAL